MSGRSPTRPLKCSSDAEDIINAVLTMDEERCAFRSQIAALEAECAVYRAALKLIAGSDYRGNRPREHRIAQEPLDAYPDN